MTPIVFLLVLIGVSYTSYLASVAREPLKTSDVPDKRHFDAA